MKFKIFLIVFVSFVNCLEAEIRDIHSPEVIYLNDCIINNFWCLAKQKYNLFGLELIDGWNNRLKAFFFDVRGKQVVDIARCRYTMLDLIDNLSKRIKVLEPYLSEKPFTYDNIQIQLGYVNSDPKHLSRKLGNQFIIYSVNCKDGALAYILTRPGDSRYWSYGEFVDEAREKILQGNPGFMEPDRIEILDMNKLQEEARIAKEKRRREFDANTKLIDCSANYPNGDPHYYKR